MKGGWKTKKKSSLFPSCKLSNSDKGFHCSAQWIQQGRACHFGAGWSAYWCSRAGAAYVRSVHRLLHGGHFLRRMIARADQLSAEEVHLKSSMIQRRKQVLKHKSLVFFKELMEEAGSTETHQIGIVPGFRDKISTVHSSTTSPSSH